MKISLEEGENGAGSRERGTQRWAGRRKRQQKLTERGGERAPVPVAKEGQGTGSEKLPVRKGEKGGSEVAGRGEGGRVIKKEQPEKGGERKIGQDRKQQRPGERKNHRENF